MSDDSTQAGFRPAIGIAVLALIVLGTWWWAEQGLASGMRYLLMVVCAVLVALLSGRWLIAAKTMRVIALAVVVPATIAGWWIGGNSHNRAFGDCVVHGARVQQQLLAYRTATGRYPDRLSDLPRRACGERVLHGTVLAYTRTPGGYRISMGEGRWVYEGDPSRRFARVQ